MATRARTTTAARKPAAKAAPAATPKNGATKKPLDFTNVKEAGNFSPKHKTEGDYLGKIVKVEDSESKAGNAMWVFTIVLASDARATYPYYCTLDEKSLWKVRALIEATGKPVPKKRIMVDPNGLVGKEIGVALEDDEYEDKVRSKVQATFPTDELSGDEPDDAGDDDEDPVDDEDPIDDDEEVDGDDDLEEMELDDL
jgi:hypothetical protein